MFFSDGDDGHDFFLDGEKKVVSDEDEDFDVRKRLVHVWGLQAVALVERRRKEVDEMKSNLSIVIPHRSLKGRNILLRGHRV